MLLASLGLEIEYRGDYLLMIVNSSMLKMRDRFQVRGEEVLEVLAELLASFISRLFEEKPRVAEAQKVGADSHKCET
jgi:hypothetical protein